MKKRIYTLLLALSLGATANAIAAANAAAQSAPAPPPTAAKQQFFLKLIPPRPTFATDMTADEVKLMEQHAEYWASQFPNGTVLLIGPVLDPRGVFGIVILETNTEAEARTLANNDPTVKAGLNKFDLVPMQVFYAKK